jgi:penicillin amidase
MPSDRIADSSERRFEVNGLNERVEITIDRWGLAHIRAAGYADLFFAQGYNAARDRLWQIDLWRRRGLGLLAAAFGPGFLEQDRAARLFLYRGDMEAEWAAYAPDANAMCEAFAAGINAYVDRVERGQEKLPIEFDRLGARPSRWKAEDVVRIRSHCLTRNAISEVLRANVFANAGARADALRKQLEPHVEPFTDPDRALSEIPLTVIDVFKLATAPVTFSKERLAARLGEANRWTRMNALGEVVQAIGSEGSNNWAISPARTATGRPIMGMDPHRTYAVPALRYMVHLSMPGFNAIGAGEPAVPGISLGHNGHSAFSVTIFGADQEDVCVYDTKPDDPNAYRYGDGWETMTTVEDVFEVKGWEPQRLPLRFTRHGPVVFEDRELRKAYAIRTVWSEPGSAPYLASFSAMRARSFDDYRKALRNWGTPSINHLYADVTGTIGWQAAGKTPIRPNWTGLMPVPGDGRYEWRGYVAPEDLPSACNPQGGFLATANEMNIPSDWAKANPPIGYEWVDHSRSQRIHRVLDSQPSHTLPDSCALQNDLYSIPAERMQAVLRDLLFESAAAHRAAVHMTDWDCVMGPDSSQAALFEIWLTSHLKPALFQTFANREEIASLLQPGDIQSVHSVVERPGEWFIGDADTARREILEYTLVAAWRDCEERLGADPALWRWGQLHQLSLKHALTRAFPELSTTFDVEPMELGGSGSTAMCAAYRPDDFQTITGASVRMVIDVGNWDNCLFINLPGQSGDADSPHYRDLKEAWRNGEYKPLLYSREAIDRETEMRIVLEPARKL